MIGIRRVVFSLAIIALCLIAGPALAATYHFSSIDYPGAVGSAGNGIATSGQIVGYYVAANKNTHGFLKVDSSYTSIDYPGATDTWPTGINASGQIVGNYKDANGNFHGFFKVGSDCQTIYYPEGIDTSLAEHQ